MDPNAVVLEISSDEDVDWNDYARGISNWVNDSDEVVVVNEFRKPVKKLKSECCLVDLDDDCVVLDKDPNEPVEVREGKSGNGGDDDSDDIVVVSEKGQVACRDYPHSRHLCIKFPFSTTPNQSHCNQCYCYVCDSLAPCVYWGNGSASADHCHATDKDEFWILERKNAKNGSKAVQPVSQLPPVGLLYTLASVAVQPQNQIPKPGPRHANHTLTNFLSPDIINPHRNNILASSNKLHLNLVSQPVLRVNRPVFKRTDSVRAATTANRNPYSSYRGNFGNPIGQQNYQVNGMVSGSSKYLGSLQLNAANTSVPYPPQSQTYTSPPQSQTYTSSTVNLPNPSFQSHVSSYPLPENPLYQQLFAVPPSSSRPQSASSQQTYMVPAQPSYPVPSKTKVDSPLVPVSDFTPNTSQGNQSQGPIVDSGFKDYGLGLPTGQDSATLKDTVSTNESPLEAVSGGLADYRFDWIFDNQPIEPGFTDYSYDSAFIDTGLIFDF
ncbi:hypothetical protein L1987_03926 [Smallanthus sonchifolius]|uniref:Uncharacterized protein n=1 Tax=Smallanthus sonchifolius TaxID=185202 RepID=A0ACB9KC32_9ASTR|nr:hypothetical protein L1987_03926 [Smallanthus sonchifolius]